MYKFVLEYLFRMLFVIPALPFLAKQGKRIKRSVPRLPEAQDPAGQYLASNSEDFQNILFLGESTMAGVGVSSHKNGFAAAFAQVYSELQSCNTNWTVIARSGYEAKDVYHRFLPKLRESAASGDQLDLIVIGLGGNDAFALKAPWRWTDDIKAILNCLKDIYPDSRIVFANMPPIRIFPAFSPLIQTVVGGHVEMLGRVLNYIVSDSQIVSYDAEVIELESWCKRYGLHSSDPNLYFSDGVHPSELTYKVWGESLARFTHNQIMKSS